MVMPGSNFLCTCEACIILLALQVALMILHALSLLDFLSLEWPVLERENTFQAKNHIEYNFVLENYTIYNFCNITPPLKSIVVLDYAFP